jgi:hypothetical protein
MSIKKSISNKKFSDLTERPTLFKNSYWGCFSVEKNTQIDDDIVKNRNEFSEEFKIKTYSGNDRPISRGTLFDHCELYKCESGYIYVTSPYGEYDEIAMEKGFTRYKKLYLPDATTYIKLFESKVEFNRFLKL